MGAGKKIIGFIVLIIILALVGWWLLAGIQDVSIDSFALTGLQSIDAEGFTFAGELGIVNPSNAPVPIDAITYTATLEKTGETVSTGELDPFTLQANQVTTTGITGRVQWVPTAQTASSLLTDDAVWMLVEGEAVIGTDDISATLTFSDRIDIAEYVEQFLPAGQQVRDVTTQASDTSGADDLVDDTVGTLP